MHEWSFYCTNGCGGWKSSCMISFMNFGVVSSFRYFLWAGIFLVLIFTVLQPAAVEGIGVFKSLLFWTVQIGILIPLLVAVHTLLQEITIFNRLNPWVKTTFAGILSAFLFIPVALGLDYALGLDDWTAILNQDDFLKLVVEEISGLVLPVTLTWVAINAPRILQLNFQITSLVNDEKNDVSVQAVLKRGLLEQLPKKIGTDIVYLASELHYLRVVTTQGDTLLLSSLNNAIAQLEKSMDGIQTHRSYWVNKAHIYKLVGRGPEKNILTKQGHIIPVSRRQLAAVKKYLLT